ncbi:MAG: chorismate-binding protein, partial [Thermomicrobium sp.]
MRRDMLASTLPDLWAIAERRARALQRPVLLSWSKLIEPLDPIALFTADTSSTPRILWLIPQTGEAIVGLRCQRLPVQEVSPFPSSALTRLAHSWRWHAAEAVQEGPLAPLAFAGCAFEPEDPRIDTWWEPFGNLQAFLPRLAYVQRGELSAQLVQHAVRPDECAPLTPPDWPPTTPSSSRTRPSVVRRHDRVSPAHWAELVETARNAIHRGELRKVVLARVVELTAERPFPLEITLRALAERYPSCTIFAVGIGETVFLGATPERLVKVENGTVSTVALAGSAPRSADPTRDKALAAQLLT